MKIKFFLYDTENDLKKIFVRLRDGRRFDKVAWTEKQTLKKLWNPNKEEIRDKTIIQNNGDNVTQTINDSREQTNSFLADLRTYLTARYNDDFPKSLTLDKNWLREQIKAYSNRVDFTESTSSKYYLTEWIQAYLSEKKNLINSKTGKPLSQQTIKSYKSNLAKLKKFESYQKKHYRFEELTHNDFYKDFIHWCRNCENLNDNTTGKAVTILKTFFGLIKDEDLPICLDFEKKNKFVGVSESTSDIYLNEDEINKIFNLDLSNNLRLDNVRDRFIIGLWTGLRISDFKRLDTENIKKGVITIETQKTKKKVSIGIHPQLKAVLDKRDGEFPPEISDQKFNEYVKEVVELAQITNKVTASKMVKLSDKNGNILKDEKGNNIFRKVKGIYPKYEVVSSHTCRRSFCTNLYKSKKLPLSILMSLSGHSSETQFIEYIKISTEENAALMNDYFNHNLSGDNLIAPLQIAN
ncbi:site-specific integrase [Kaistella polysaccharea]|uniref:site-specific integrase n=1 Tax=Kaistella polysaccharea TaxID=2878534 RepID=UPI001CF1BF17|nr:site-specific integrase [Kaistella polysaccharea]